MRRSLLALLPLLALACTGGGASDDQDGDGVPVSSDCDDTDPDVFPGATEICNDIDDNCDGFVDRDALDATRWYRDVDGDGYGDPDVMVRACEPPADGYVDNDDDCADLFENSYPGADEVCDGNDNDCDGDIDEDALDPRTWYLDGDGDGFGVADDTVEACAPPEGYVGGPGDCDDTVDTVNPGADEVCNEVDDDCDEVIDEPDAVDAVEHWPDEDGDGYGDPAGPTRLACPSPEGWAPTDDDCNDDEARVHPDRDEVCDGLDNDCAPSTSEDGLVSLSGVTVADLDAAGAAATSGDIIGICPGTHTTTLAVDVDLTLQGHGGKDRITLRPGTADTPILTISDSAAVTIAGLTFADGEAERGGAIDAGSSGALLINDVDFTGNTATDGGALYGPRTYPLTLTDCTFSGNTATGDGGAVVASEVSTARTSFTGNRAARGGALVVDGGDATLDEDTRLSANEATGDGGAIAMLSANRLTDGEVDGNSAAGDGGGVWLADGATVITTAILNNEAGDAGGGVHLVGDGTVEALALTANSAARGGGLASVSGAVTLQLCDLTQNSATDEGGGVLVLGGTLTIDGGTVSDNTATSGGGAWVEGGTLESDTADWGTGSTDNDPDDVAIGGGPSYDAYGTSASFTCDTSSGCE